MTPVEVFIAMAILFTPESGLVGKMDPEIHRSQGACNDAITIYQEAIALTDIEIKWIGCTPVVIPLTPVGDPT